MSSARSGLSAIEKHLNFVELFWIVFSLLRSSHQMIHVTHQFYELVKTRMILISTFTSFLFLFFPGVPSPVFHPSLLCIITKLTTSRPPTPSSPFLYILTFFPLSFISLTLLVSSLWFIDLLLVQLHKHQCCTFHQHPSPSFYRCWLCVSLCRCGCVVVGWRTSLAPG